MFKSLRVKKKLFKELESKGKIISLYPGDQYALEGITPANELLSILLNGRMKVTYEEIHLHNVTPNQFIDSPEWEASTFDRDQIFQVTVTAIEKCVYFCWTRKSLEQIFKANPVLHSIINNLIGRDITNKLYSVNEQLHVFKKTSSRSSRCGSSTNSAALSWIQAAIPRSLSVDEVHTSRTGQVRSLNWKENRHHCIIGGGSRFQSCGSSPARWSKDPAHFAESKNIYRVRRHLSSNSRLPSKSVGPMKQSGRQAQVLLHVAFAKPV
ncbi:BVES (predicted) [Pycnogonum litorale]